MKKGEYIRTRWGTIGKIVDIPKHNIWFDDGVNLDNGEFVCIGRQLIKEYPSTKNIYELIEVGDLIYLDIEPGYYGGIIVPRVPETEAELKRYTDKLKSGEYKLMGVVTRERLSKNMYQVRK